MHWRTLRAPVVVAEALLAVPDPLLAAVAPPAEATLAGVARALVRSLAPAEARDPPPPWLWPEQAPAFRRLVAAVRRFGGALLADPVGSGKSYIALAAARAINGPAPTACLVPAALVTQWRELAARLGVPVVVSSHERASRGRLPDDARGLAIVDESHRFREPATRRYHHAAEWLVGRQTILLSATPAVNRLADVATQLRLSVRDDALAPLGVASLAAALAGDDAPAALGRLVFARARDPRRTPVRQQTATTPGATAGTRAALAAIDRLTLSRHPPIAALLRGVFWRALASSPAALGGVARRYRGLLLHARDAAVAGRALSRGALREVIAGAEAQLVLWSLVDGDDEPADLDAADLPVLDRIAALAHRMRQRRDPKCDALAALLADRRPTLVFTTACDTVRYLRDRLDDAMLAWCTGAAAGIGHTSMARDAVLRWFRAPDSALRAPSTLVCTDVAAEGLDLRRVERVVHYDLPWTAMRVEQREGRAVRAGSTHARIDVVTFHPPPAVERRLAIDDRLRTKARLPLALGIADDGMRWRWRAELAERYGRGDAAIGCAAVRSPHVGALVGVAQRNETADDGWVVWLDGSGWTEAPELIAARLAEAFSAEPRPLRRGEALEWVTRVVPLLRERLRFAAGFGWHGASAPPARALIERLQQLAGAAARARDRRRLAEIERALRFAAGGHTAGEAARVASLALAEPRTLATALRQLPPPTPDRGTVLPRLTGVLVFRHS